MKKWNLNKIVQQFVTSSKNLLQKISIRAKRDLVFFIVESARMSVFALANIVKSGEPPSELSAIVYVNISTLITL